MAPTVPGTRRIEFLTRPECSLCDRVERRLRPVARRLGIQVVEVRVDDDDDLVAEFGLRIPVVRRPGGAVLGEGDWGGAAMWFRLIGVAVRPGPGGAAARPH